MNELPKDIDRLQRIAVELADAFVAREEGHKKVRLPVVQRSDAAGLTQIMHAQLDSAIERRNAQIGKRMACHRGCNSCCISPVLVTEGEAVAVAEWLKLPEHADARARFDAAYRVWAGKLGEMIMEADRPRDADENLQWCIEVKRREAMCPFNHDGACTVYPVRPALCRKTHALDTNAHCANDGMKVAYYQHEETEAVYEAQRPVRFALHAALRPKGRMDLLPYAVHRLLDGAAAGRNEPCPCGSGKKYKKCCGS